MSLTCTFTEKEKLSEKTYESLGLAELLKDERDFTILVQGKTYFHDALFPILEFVWYCRCWLKEKNSNFVYNSVESDENPLLSFTKESDGWRLYSVWQEFSCEEVFSEKEIEDFLTRIMKQIIH